LFRRQRLPPHPAEYPAVRTWSPCIPDGDAAAGADAVPIDNILSLAILFSSLIATAILLSDISLPACLKVYFFDYQNVASDLNVYQD
jgi:hypothetical protein